MTPITDDFQGHLGLAAIITTVIETAKRLNVPGLGWLNQRSATASAALSAVAAFITAFGFQMTWEGTWISFHDLMQNGGVMSFMLTIPSLDTLVRAAGQMALNQGVYHGILKPATTKDKQNA